MVVRSHFLSLPLTDLLFWLFFLFVLLGFPIFGRHYAMMVLNSKNMANGSSTKEWWDTTEFFYKIECAGTKRVHGIAKTISDVNVLFENGVWDDTVALCCPWWMKTGRWGQHCAGTANRLWEVGGSVRIILRLPDSYNIIEEHMILFGFFLCCRD